MIVSFAIARGLRFASMIELSRPCFCHELYQRVILHTVSSRNRRSWPCAHRRMPPLAGLTALRRAEGPPTFWHPGNGSWGQRFLGSDRTVPGPGRSRDYSLELPQIRACTSNAPGSSRCGIAVPHTTGWFRGDTRVRRDVLGVVPTPRPQRGTPFAPRGPEGPFPRFNTTMGRCDSLSSISPRFVSFAWRYHRSSPVRPHRLGTELWINLELVSRGSSRQSRWRRQGLPSSRETHLIIRHVPPTPV